MSKLLIAWGILLVLSLGCLGGGDDEVVTAPPVVVEAPEPEPEPIAPPEVEEPEPEIIVPSWMKDELTDPITTETIKISDFLGKPILILNFNSDITASLKQHQAMEELKGNMGDSVVLISLNLDESMDKRYMESYVNKHGFDWYFVLPSAATKDNLVNSFGLDVINPEKVPLVLICSALDSRLLEQGVKSVDTLQSEIDSC
jgi:hypothetical protein